MNQLLSQMLVSADPSQVAGLSRFFKTGPGQYGEGDKFLGIKALLTLVQIFTHARKDAAQQQRCIDFYLGHTEYINNWDLVDLSCYELLGRWLLERDRSFSSLRLGIASELALLSLAASVNK